MQVAQAVTGVVAGLSGLPVGSYVTVLADRVPDNQNVLRPLGRCTLCQARLRLADMIPVGSWLRLHGRCPACRKPFGVRYLVAELLTAAVFAALGARLGPSVLLIAMCYLSATGLALALIDIEHQRLPFALTIPSYFAMAALLATAAPYEAGRWRHLAGSLAGMLVLWLFYAALACLLPGQLGWGDVWLAGLLGLGLGWFGTGVLITGALAGWLTAVPTALRRIAARRNGEEAPVIALGPFMVCGAILAILVG